MEEVTSALSYLEESVVPVRSTLSTGISLTPSAGSKDLADRLESEGSSAVLPQIAMSSVEAMIVVACSQHSTSHS